MNDSTAGDPSTSGVNRDANPGLTSDSKPKRAVQAADTAPTPRRWIARRAKVPNRTPAQKVGSFVKEILIVAALGLLVSTLLRTFVFQMFEIPSESMENTLLINDRVAVQKLTAFQRGDVVVFADPGGWLNTVEPAEPTWVDRGLEFVGLKPDSSAQFLIKRVIGMPGDTVVCCNADGQLVVNGRQLNETDYLYSDSSGPIAPSDVVFEVTVPADRIFVMGDHRNASADSRCHLSDRGSNGEVGDSAFIPVDKVVGVAFAVTYPFNRISPMNRPSTYEGIPPAVGPAPERPRIEPAGVTC